MAKKLQKLSKKNKIPIRKTKKKFTTHKSKKKGGAGLPSKNEYPTDYETDTDSDKDDFREFGDLPLDLQIKRYIDSISLLDESKNIDRTQIIDFNTFINESLVKSLSNEDDNKIRYDFNEKSHSLEYTDLNEDGIYGDLRKIYSLSFFGIELEICMKIHSQSYQEELDNLHDEIEDSDSEHYNDTHYFDTKISEIIRRYTQNIFNSKIRGLIDESQSLGTKSYWGKYKWNSYSSRDREKEFYGVPRNNDGSYFFSSDNTKEKSGKLWTMIDDASISCNTPNNFFRVEIVSPILQMGNRIINSFYHRHSKESTEWDTINLSREAIPNNWEDVYHSDITEFDEGIETIKNIIDSIINGAPPLNEVGYTQNKVHSMFIRKNDLYFIISLKPLSTLNEIGDNMTIYLHNKDWSIWHKCILEKGDDSYNIKLPNDTQINNLSNIQQELLNVNVEEIKGEPQDKCMSQSIKLLGSIELQNPICNFEQSPDDMIRNTCGLHVHYSNPMMKNNRIGKYLLWNFCRNWYFFEPIINMLISPDRVFNKYCINMNPHFSPDIKNIDKSAPELIAININDPVSIKFILDNMTIEQICNFYCPPIHNSRKYSKVNLTYARKSPSNKPLQIEIRCHEGTSDYNEIRNWIVLINKFISNSITFSLNKMTPDELQYLFPDEELEEYTPFIKGTSLYNTDFLQDKYIQNYFINNDMFCLLFDKLLFDTHPTLKKFYYNKIVKNYLSKLTPQSYHPSAEKEETSLETGAVHSSPEELADDDRFTANKSIAESEEKPEKEIMEELTPEQSEETFKNKTFDKGSAQETLIHRISGELIHDIDIDKLNIGWLNSDIVYPDTWGILFNGIFIPDKTIDEDGKIINSEKPFFQRFRYF